MSAEMLFVHDGKLKIRVTQKLFHYMRNLHFKNKVGEEMSFDSNGDPPALYDIINWQLQQDGSMRYIKVGRFDSRLPTGAKLYFDSSAIHWNSQTNQVPRSVCTESCAPGYRKAIQNGQPACCFDCIRCGEGEISNETDSGNCLQCPSDRWPNERRSECVPKVVEFLSYQDILGTTLTCITSVFSFTTAVTLTVFIKFRDTPIVKANNREVTYVLLIALLLSFLCPLLFIGEPQQTTCLLRQPAFGIIFVFCVSCVLAKTIMVVIAFSATKPGSNMRKWLGPQVPLAILSLCTLGQVLICGTWLLVCPSFPEKNKLLRNGIIIFQCNECSEVAFWCMLGYIGFLSCVSFLVAFMARKLPDSFNEAKWITFSMLVFLSVWLSFVPGYLSTHGKFMVAVEVFGIISSSAGLLTFIFVPKVFIILLRPHLNKKEYLFRKNPEQ
ncbi:vomeronasal type-2 receptor 26-like [Pleurodeles waltl]|uniref:vomeronasal type-2 receptor 26-like n=1 Tax=Pleurodeles waltl TaxID=8319 RepID=UPI003709A74D